jgi:cytoskeletal protein RodZ
MNIAGKGILLLGFFVAIGVIVLSEGFNDTSSYHEPGQETPVVEEESESSSTSETESSEEAEETSTVVDDTSSASPPSTTSESSGESVLHPPAEVRVLVANATNVSGAASAIKEVLVSDQGYNGLAPVNDTSEEVPAESFVYFANGYELDARNISVIINVSRDNVIPMPAALPVTDLSEANVLVLLGSDLYPEE